MKGDDINNDFKYKGLMFCGNIWIKCDMFKSTLLFAVNQIPV